MVEVTVHKRGWQAGLAAVVVIAACFILWAMLAYRQSLMASLTNGVYASLAELSNNNASNIVTRVEDQFQTLETMASYMAGMDLKGNEVKRLMREMVDTHGFLRCALTFPDDSYVTHDGKGGQVKGVDDYLTDGFAGKLSLVGPRRAIAEPDKTVILLSVPIFLDGQVEALLTATYETAQLSNVFQTVGFGGESYSYITDGQGQIIAMPNRSGALYGGSNILEFLREKTLTVADYERAAQDLASGQAGNLAFEWEDARQYLDYRPLGLNDWYIISVAPGNVMEAQMNAILQEVYWLTLTIFGALLVLLSAVGLFFYQVWRHARQDLLTAAYFDSLTGLPNRVGFERQARAELAAGASERRYAYLVLDVNRFKLINDRFGFEEGDRLLQHIAQALRHEQQAGECFGRGEADQFHILAAYTTQGALEQRIKKVAEEIETFHFHSPIRHKLAVRFGVYVLEDVTLPINTMGDRARMALAMVKAQHKGLMTYYNDELIEQMADEQDIENNLQAALERQDFHMVLQPKFRLSDGKVAGAEALVRWQHPVKGLMTPDRFIPVLERTGLIVALDMYMVETACRQLYQWRQAGQPVVPISVNQSKFCLYHTGYLEELMAILRRYDTPPGLIELEITENAFFEDQEALVEIVGQLHKQGFTVAMDDFGSGYSSLNMLQEVWVDVLKFDKKFFKDSVHSDRGKTIVRHMADMAHGLDMVIVAEGIETQEQLDFLKQIPCDLVQGFYFSRPLEREDFERLMKRCR